MNFSKTKYVEFMCCHKAAWLTAHKPEVKKVDDSAFDVIQAGIKIGELAKGYFGDYVDMTTYKEDGSLDLVTMARKTEKAIADGVQNICEAAFLHDGLYCAVDILHKSKRGEIEGYEIYEVKSSSKMKDRYYYDIAYQTYVAKECGVNILDFYVLHINSDYVLQGELDIKKLLVSDDKSKRPLWAIGGPLAVKMMLNEAEGCLKEEEFDCIGEQCGDWCGYWEYCSRNLPKPNVFDLYDCRKKWKYYEDGIVSFEDIVNSGIKLTDIQQRQIECADPNAGTYGDKDGITEFLNTLTYPLYFLDFETMGLAIPEIEGTHPFEQIPFQYSLHYFEEEGGEVRHKEYLAEEVGDPRRSLAERLCADIPEGACILAYHASTEKGVVKKLAEQFSDLNEKLTDIRFSIIDLLPVFQKGYYYNRAMGKSLSIKSVLPAVFPELNYHNLDGVQNGTDAMDIFPKIKNMSPEEARKTRKQLLEYCKRDTMAMVKLWQELVRVSK